MKRVCKRAGCGTLVDRAGWCAPCSRAYEQGRGTTTQRGYGTPHQHLRRDWDAIVQYGKTECTRCGGLIAPDTEWELDHTDSRDGYRGPSHKQCNRSAGGYKRAGRSGT